jgi:hypothetical protein
MRLIPVPRFVFDASVAAAAHPAQAPTDATVTSARTLERTAGDVRPVARFSAAAIAAYENVLDAPIATVAFTSVPARELWGDTLSETTNFTNTAASGVGYGHAVEVLAPNTPPPVCATFGVGR